MCIQLRSFKCEPATLRCGLNDVTFIITYNNPDHPGQRINGLIESTRPEDPYRFVLNTGSEVAAKEFQHTLQAGQGEIRIPAQLKITAGNCDGRGRIQFGVEYRLGPGASHCQGRVTLIRF